MKRWIMVVPLAVFLLVAVFLYKGLFLKPDELPSAMIGKPFPVFSWRRHRGPHPDSGRLAGAPGTGQRVGHLVPVVQGRAPVPEPAGTAGVVIHGVNYKDDNAAAQKWLAEFHNPYQLDIRDEQGSLGLDLGVYGAPETFLIDAKGIIRYKHVGIVDATVWREQLAPLYQGLIDEAKP